MKTVLLLSER